MKQLLKVLIYIKDVQKPLVFTCSEIESTVYYKKFLELIDRFMNGEVDRLVFDSGDILKCKNEDIKAILITKDKLND